MKNGRPVKFPLPCTQMALDVMDGEDVALGLTERFRFYVNEQEVCASYCRLGLIENGLSTRTKQLYECPCLAGSQGFCQCSCHRIIMKFTGIVTFDKSNVHAKSKGQRSNLKVTKVETNLY